MPSAYLIRKDAGLTYRIDIPAWLQLLHMADSALPIGAMAHSFGIETLAAEYSLTEDSLPTFFSDWLLGTGKTEAAFCLWGHAAATHEQWTRLNAQLSSFKPARESRDASLRLGKRFLSLASTLTNQPHYAGEAHLGPAFGLIGAAMNLDSTMVAAAYLHQTLFGAISVCQRLLPFGQSAAMRLLWNLKSQIAEAVEQAKTATLEDLWNIQPALDIASMRHPQLTTRLFIS
jgi:urease accessory protein